MAEAKGTERERLRKRKDKKAEHQGCFSPRYRSSTIRCLRSELGAHTEDRTLPSAQQSNPRGKQTVASHPCPHQEKVTFIHTKRNTVFVHTPSSAIILPPPSDCWDPLFHVSTFHSPFSKTGPSQSSPLHNFEPDLNIYMGAALSGLTPDQARRPPPRSSPISWGSKQGAGGRGRLRPGGS